MKQPIILTSFATFILTSTAMALPVCSPTANAAQPLVHVDMDSINEALGNKRNGHIAVDAGSTYTSEVHFNMMQDDKNVDLRIEIDNGEYTITFNGKEIPEDRYSLDNGKLIIEDENGNVIFDHDVHGLDDSNNNGHTQIEMQFDSDHAQQHQSQDTGDEPRGRIGISMDSISEALAWHLGVQNEAAFMIVDVVPGLPADKAGLEPYDVIVRVNDQSAEQEMFRNLVQQSKPGSEIRLDVIHKGKRKTVTVKTTKWENDSEQDQAAEQRIAPDNRSNRELDERHRILLERIEKGRAQREKGNVERIERLRDLGINVEEDIDIHFEVDRDHHEKMEMNKDHDGHGDSDHFQFDIEFDGDIDLGMLNQLLNREFDRNDLHDAIIRLERQPFVREFRNGLMRGKVDASIDGLHIDPDMIHRVLEGVMEEIEVNLDDDVREQIEAALDHAKRELRNHLKHEDGDDLQHDGHVQGNWHADDHLKGRIVDLKNKENVIFEMIEDGKPGEAKVMILMRDGDGKDHEFMVDEIGGKVELKTDKGDRIKAKRIELQKAKQYEVKADAKTKVENEKIIIAKKREAAAEKNSAAVDRATDARIRAKKIYDRITRLKNAIADLEAELAEIKKSLDKK